MSIGKSVLGAVSRTKKPLPIVAKAFVSPLLVEHIVPYKLILSDMKMVEWWLAGHIMKTFTQGSYALIEPPVTIEYKEKEEKIRTTFYMRVYTKTGGLIWPTRFNKNKNK